MASDKTAEDYGDDRSRWPAVSVSSIVCTELAPFLSCKWGTCIHYPRMTSYVLNKLFPLYFNSWIICGACINYDTILQICAVSSLMNKEWGFFCFWTTYHVLLYRYIQNNILFFPEVEIELVLLTFVFYCFIVESLRSREFSTQSRSAITKY